MTLNHAIRHFCRPAALSLLFCIGLIAILIAPVGAQDAGFGSISGTITDQKNSVVAGATVTVTQVETGISRDLVTTSAGTFRRHF
jgi:type 1 fimbria pilin